MDDASISKNIQGIRQCVEKVVDPNDKDVTFVNNADWLDDLKYTAFLRDIGVHFSINRMIKFDSVQSRLDRESPLSFTEFNYILLQSYDFLELYRRYGCTIQVGGSDQWGNITTGTELIRRKERGEAFAMTCPLITKADGGKFGKTESGNVWLDPEKTSPYHFYQFPIQN